MILNARQIDTMDLIRDSSAKGKRAQVGYDLSVKGIKEVVGGTITKDRTSVSQYKVIGVEEGYYNLEAHKAYSITFDQGVRIPADLCAVIRGRSSVVRCGGFVSSGIYDPGFEVDECGAILFTYSPIKIEEHSRLAQIIFSKVAEAVSSDDLYDGQWQSHRDIK